VNHEHLPRPLDTDQKHPRKAADRGVSLATLIMVSTLVLVVGFVLGTRSDGLISTINRTFGTSIKSSARIELSQAQEAYQTLRDHYDGNVDTAKLQDGAAHGLTAGLGDPHTVYFNSKEAAEYQNELSGSLTGIGAEIGLRNDQPTILRILANSPAEKADIKKGDVIAAVNDKSVKGFSAYDTATLIRGKEGTDVKLTLLRNNVPQRLTLTRAQVTDPSVASRLDGTTGIITIRRFDSDTGALARMQARKLLEQGAETFILDLRDNGGGYLNQAQSVAGLWLSDQVVVSERHANVQTDKLYSTGDAVLRGRKTVVLINGSSASASEVVAGALKDHKVATLLGEKSFGKGTVQQIFDLSDGNKIKVTIAHWFTPDGNTIDKKGITPDVTVKLTAEQMNKGQDPQLEAALKKLQ
jgi:carboxyl-terminal processing protease